MGFLCVGMIIDSENDNWGASMNCGEGACQLSKVRAKIRGSLGFVLGIP